VLANLQTAYGEASEVHMGASGYFALFRKQAAEGKRQKLYHVSQLEDVMHAARSAPDTYVSQASFINARSRRISSVASLGCAFVDIDCYKVGLAPDERLVEQIIGCATQLGLPEPTYVVSSGRGLYVKWLFEQQLPAAQIERWQRLQGVLIPLYRALGSDPGVRDAARVLRAVESVNSSANDAIVRVVHASGRRVRFEDLWHAVSSIDASVLADVANERGTKSASKVIERKVRAAVAGSMTSAEALAFEARARDHLLNFSAAREPIMLPEGARLGSLNWRRFVDLRDLCLLRGGPRAGMRDMALFWMANFLGLSGVVDVNNLEAEVRDLASCFEGVGHDYRPIDDGSMTSLKERLAMRAAGRRIVFRNVEFDALYTPSNEHLIDLFEISADEQQQLATIIGDQEKLRRADMKVPGRAERRQERLDLGAAARDLARRQEEAGERIVASQIATAIGASRWQVARWLKQTPLTAQERREKKAERRHAANERRAAARRLQREQGGATAAPASAQVYQFPRPSRAPDRAPIDALSKKKLDELRTSDPFECADFAVSKEGGEEARGRSAPSSTAEVLREGPSTVIPFESVNSPSSLPSIHSKTRTDLAVEGSSAKKFGSTSPADRPGHAVGGPAGVGSGSANGVARPGVRSSASASGIPGWVYEALDEMTRGDHGQVLPPEQVIQRLEARQLALHDQLEARARADDDVIRKRLAASIDKLRQRQGDLAAVPAPLASPFSRFLHQQVNQETGEITAAPASISSSSSRVSPCVDFREKSGANPPSGDPACP
jgi:hypothetical protein